jgi:hypothetical protein
MAYRGRAVRHSLRYTPGVRPTKTQETEAMSLFRTKTETSPKTDARKVVFTGKRIEGTWVMETNLAVPVRRSALHGNIVVADNRRVRTLH